ncbi:hypothetical protein [Paracoccus sp. PAR01]|uniref:hypothetical protein n=1 Tax=Paracoccus sp. PAR01 TaxID=2769282 RepID=UPI0017873B70|nr:hypothetical protein [Paracoccus sp. PAR01]MBD9529010.1 hypothetical protein [Paracoccus sp. PAR01]
MLRHSFPTGMVQMDAFAVDLSNMSSEQALAEIDRAFDHAWQVFSDFKSALADAELLVRNTGSIHGNAVAFPIAGESDRFCTRCAGTGLMQTFHADTEATVSQTCPDCGGNGFGGPVIRAL